MLADHEDRRDDQVPGCGNKQQGNGLEKCGGDIRGAAENLMGIRNRDNQRRSLEQRDELIARGRDDDAHCLWHHGAAHGHPPAKAQSLGRFLLALRHGRNTGADNLCHVRGFIKT